MRKSIIASKAAVSEAQSSLAPKQAETMTIVDLARAEVSSEDPEYPVENVFSDVANDGWRAGEPGEQMLRLIFDEPVEVARISLVFEELAVARTQEIALRWKRATGDWREIIRQQWNFSPTGSTTESETWQVKLDALQQLELRIKPDVGGGEAIASLKRWLVA